MFASKSSNDVKCTRVHHMCGWRATGMNHEKIADNAVDDQGYIINEMQTQSNHRVLIKKTHNSRKHGVMSNVPETTTREVYLTTEYTGSCVDMNNVEDEEVGQ